MFAMPIKKISRQIKIKQFIIDTPGSSFDKAMDIMGPLSKTEKGNEYIFEYNVTRSAN